MVLLVMRLLFELSKEMVLFPLEAALTSTDTSSHSVKQSNTR